MEVLSWRENDIIGTIDYKSRRLPALQKPSQVHQVGKTARDRDREKERERGRERERERERERYRGDSGRGASIFFKIQLACLYSWPGFAVVTQKLVGRKLDRESVIFNDMIQETSNSSK